MGDAIGQMLTSAVSIAISPLPLGVYLAGGTRPAKLLGDWKAWMARHNAAIMTTLLLVLGVKYIGDAVSGLTV